MRDWTTVVQVRWDPMIQHQRGRNYIGHDCIGQNYVGHDYLGVNLDGQAALFDAPLDEAVQVCWNLMIQHQTPPINM